MKWLVGLDLRDATVGSVAWARWLKRKVPEDQCVGVRVFEPIPGFVLDDEGTAPEAKAKELLADALAPFEASHAFSNVSVVVGAGPSRQLVSACEKNGCDALVVGRRAPVRSDRLIRLGKVARHLASQLPCPLVVVPPDLSADDIPDGPVVVAVDVSDSCKAAVAWGLAFAKRVGRTVTLAHVSHVPDLGFSLPGEFQKKLEEGVVAQSRDAFESWVQEAGLGDLKRLHLEGSVAPALMSGADDCNACVLVAGSRRLSGLQRVFISPVGSDLAANADRPVALVPPPD